MPSVEDSFYYSSYRWFCLTVFDESVRCHPVTTGLPSSKWLPLPKFLWDSNPCPFTSDAFRGDIMGGWRLIDQSNRVEWLVLTASSSGWDLWSLHHQAGDLTADKLYSNVIHTCRYATEVGWSRTRLTCISYFHHRSHREDSVWWWHSLD